MDHKQQTTHFDLEYRSLALNSIYQAVFAFDGTEKEDTDCQNGFGVFLGACWTMCCCFFPSLMLSTGCRRRHKEHYIHPDFRIGTSMVEWVVLMVWAIGHPEDGKYVFSFEYGLSVLIMSVLLFLVHTQYLSLLPNFALPFGASVRSKFGYALSGELEELQRFKDTESIPLKQVCVDIGTTIYMMDDVSRRSVYDMLEPVVLSQVNALKNGGEIRMFDSRDYLSHFRFCLSEQEEFTVTREQCDSLRNNIQNALDELDLDQCSAERLEVHGINPWDEAPAPQKSHKATAAMYALANEHYHVVRWLEQERNAAIHKYIFEHQSRFIFEHQTGSTLGE